MTPETMDRDTYLDMTLNGHKIAQVFLVQQGTWVVEKENAGPYFGTIKHIPGSRSKYGDFSAISHMETRKRFSTFDQALFWLCSIAGSWAGYTQK